MEIVFKPKAQQDRETIKKSGSPATKKRLERILEDILDHPYTGFANPEELKYDLPRKWSRELSKKDRVVYRVDGEDVNVFSLLGHYYDK
ncbi:addiction module toxin, Txe/YoeB family protein [Bacteroidia bacterium]|nr:addiction module toxin, Txe/YoeB family protein [Bacteroidia bacterium]